MTDVALAKLEQEKELSFIKAWEESRKSRAQNRYVLINGGTRNIALRGSLKFSGTRVLNKKMNS